MMAILGRSWDKLDRIVKNFWNKHMEEWQVINTKTQVDIYWLERCPHVDEVSPQTDVWTTRPICMVCGCTLWTEWWPQYINREI